MKATVYIKTQDSCFAQMLGNTLRGWNIAVRGQEEEGHHLTAFSEGGIDIVLLDIRRQHDDGLNLLRWLRAHAPDIEVILLNTIDRVTASMEGMRAGAADELTVPLDTDTLKKKSWKPASAERNWTRNPKNHCFKNSARAWQPPSLPRRENSIPPWE